MKKWTAKETQVHGNITAEDFNEEYSQYKSVLNGAIDRTAAPAGAFNATHLKSRAITNAVVAFKKEVDNYSDSTNTPDGYDSFRCSTYTTYQANWFTGWSEDISNLQEGWLQIELGGMVFLNPYQSTATGSLQKNLFFRLRWNNYVVAEAGPVSQGMHSFRLVAGAFNAGNSGTFRLDIRFSNRQSGDNVTAPQFHVFNLNALVIGRWR